ncbi:uncharacterized protein BDW43DRAFT_225665 [Aspergillus alliaceus]|uniref:uncharacterized protein n=1 Tax=Petromyces alliaceus TaxID=209559 RepID=UPI0012A6A729|nr:uncharacterized protein BDW43DRAFT_225665 [Aspergillus alliaceus]KAB8236818.1 hypothetical protein BDW43DRAFT_225665 [Aspergillus alliaceus]
MASSLSKGPLLTSVRSNNPVSQLYSCQYRFFSQSSQRSALRGVPENITLKQPPQPSMKTRGAALSRYELPQDLGLLPGTYVKQLWRDMPSIFQQPKERLQLEWLWLKSGFQNFIGILAYCRWLNKGLPLRLKERRQVARELHERMYSAFAEGDIAALRKICCTGLANNLASRISSRPKNERVAWSLDRYNRTPATFLTGVRVVSDRATQIPEIPDSGVRQVVVRITSRQSTGKSKVAKSGKSTVTVQTSAPVKQQDCTEYIVIQRLRWYGEDEDWRIWGHATPTTVEDLTNPLYMSGLTLSERLQAVKDQMGGH